MPNAPVVAVVPSTVRCYVCGRRAPANAHECLACAATFVAMCSAGHQVRVFDSTCGECGEELVAKRFPIGRRLRPALAKTAALAAVVAAAAWLIAPAGPQAPWRLRDAALERYGAGDFAAAAKLFDQLVAALPDDANAWYMLAASRQQLGFDADAVRGAVERALDAQPGHVEALHLAAWVAAQTHDIERAWKSARRATLVPSPDPRSFALLGELELRRDRPDAAGALLAFRRAKDGGLRDPRIDVTIADLHLRLMRGSRRAALPAEVTASLRDAAIALDAAPEDGRGQTRLSRARVHIALDESERAFDVADRALRDGAALQPEVRADFLAVRAHALLRRGNAGGARIDFVDALHASPTAELAWEIADALSDAADPAIARAVLAEAAGLDDPRGALRAVLAALHLSSGDPGAALPLVRGARGVDARSAWYAVLEGDVCRAQGRTRDAAAAYDEARRIAPDSPAPRVGSALLALDAPPGEARRARVTEAIRGLESARAEIGDDVTLLRALGVLYGAAGRHGEARDAFARAVAASPYDASMWVLLAGAERRTGSPDSLARALDALRRAGALRPGDPDLAAERASAALLTGDDDAAVAACTGALLEHPTHVRLLQCRAEAYGRAGRWAEAAHDLRTARAVSPAAPEVLVRLVDAEFRAGNRDDALRVAEHAARARDPDLAAHAEFLTAFHQRGARDAVETLADRDVPARSLACALHLQDGRVDEAVATARGVLGDAPEDARAARVLVLALLDRPAPDAAQIQEARATALRVAERSEDGLAQLLRGRVALADGDLELAVRALDAAAAALTDDPVAHALHGESLIRSGRWEEGLAAMRRSLASPGAPPALPSIVASRLVQASRRATGAEDAQRLLEEAHRIAPADSAAAAHLIALLQRRGDFRGAANVAEHAGRGDPRRAAQLRLVAAACRLAGGDLGRAQALLDGSSAEDAAHPLALTIRAFAMLHRGEAGEAERLLGQAVAAADAPSLAALGLVRVALLRQDGVAAREALRRWTDAHPDDAGAATLGAKLLAASGWPAEAEGVLRETLARHPSDRSVVAQLVTVLARLGRVEDAAAAAQAFADAAPPSSAAGARLFAAAVRGKHLGRGADALAVARSILGETGSSAADLAEARILEAEALLVLRRVKEAEAIATDAWTAVRDVAPRNGALECRVRFVLGAAAASDGSATVAAEHLRRCMELEPDDLVSANNLACVLAASRSTAAEGLALARRLTESHPWDANLWDTRASAALACDSDDEAETSWRRALDTYARTPSAPADARARVALRLADLLERRERADDAAALLREIPSYAAGTEEAGEAARRLAD